MPLEQVCIETDEIQLLCTVRYVVDHWRQPHEFGVNSGYTVDDVVVTDVLAANLKGRGDPTTWACVDIPEESVKNLIALAQAILKDDPEKVEQQIYKARDVAACNY